MRSTILILCVILLSTLFSIQVIAEGKKTVDLEKKLNSIIIEHIELCDVGIKTALKTFLIPDDINVDLELNSYHKRECINMIIENKSLLTCIKEICKEKHLKFKIKDGKLTIYSPKPEKDGFSVEGDLAVKTFKSKTKNLSKFINKIIKKMKFVGNSEEGSFFEPVKPTEKNFFKGFDSKNEDYYSENKFEDKNRKNNVTIILEKIKKENSIEVVLKGSKKFIQNCRKELLGKK